MKRHSMKLMICVVIFSFWSAHEAVAFYNPSTGRWLSRDPIENEDGMNLHEYVNNDPISNVDPDGQLTVHASPVSVGSLGCGDSYLAFFDFVLDKPSLVDGFIVQQNDVRCEVKNCPECPISSPAIPSYTFWEAWFVPKGSAKVTDKAGITFTDKKCGNKSGVGTIKFFSLKTTGDLSTKWSFGKTYGSGLCVSTPGTLPTTDKKPSWWDKKPVEGPAARWISSIWNCCCPKSFVQYTQNP